jgi:hypothetical protein
MLPILSSACASSDFSTLGSPDVTITPTSGPPGTIITITVSNIPDISKVAYPYPDLYIYLPFSQPFGVTPQSQCGGEDCIPIYTHDNAVNHDFAERTITFSLFSTQNPSTVYLNGYENSVCDVTVNGKVLERYSTLCNAKDQPTGTHDIKFGWAEENAPQINYIVKTVQFTVTLGSPQPPPQVADNGNSIIQAYQNGEISQSQFYSKLTTLGWNPEQIRQALATIGKLPHQMGAPAPDQLQQIEQGIQKAAQQVNSQPTQQPTQQITQPISPEQTAESLAPYLTQQPLQSSPQLQTDSGSAPPNNSWTMITIASSVGAAAIAGGFFAANKIRKVTN